MAVDGKAPQSVIVVSIRSAYMHCAKAFMRSDLWKPDTWPDRASLPTLGAILRDQVAYAPTAEEGDRRLDESYSQSMW